MATIISLINNKGGVGKTTSVINIGGALASRKKKVLLVDFDGQANLTKCLGLINSEQNISCDLKNKGCDPHIVAHRSGVDVIPADNSLSAFELEVSSMPARELFLKRMLSKVKERYDYILVDCPPSLGLLSFNALTASDYYVIPVECEIMSLMGLARVNELSNGIIEFLNNNLKLLGIFMTKYDHRKILNRRAVEASNQAYGKLIFKTLIRDNIALAEAPTKETNIFNYAPKANGATDYNDLTEEIIKRLQKNGKKIGCDR